VPGAVAFLVLFVVLVVAVGFVWRRLGPLLKDRRRQARMAQRGRWGEAAVRRQVLDRLNPAEYRSFHGLYLPRVRQEGTTEIDHLVVSPYGVFVVETKNFNDCDIYGHPDDRTWTLQFRSGYRDPRPNPVRQNRGHANAVGKFLGLKRASIHPIVALVGTALARTDLGPDVVFAAHLSDRIRSHRRILLDRPTVDRCCEIVARHQAATPSDTGRNHVKQVQGERAREAARAENRRRHRPSSSDGSSADRRSNQQD
jgi:restriction system protein